jgi:hypothetical protein
MDFIFSIYFLFLCVIFSLDVFNIIPFSFLQFIFFKFQNRLVQYLALVM